MPWRRASAWVKPRPVRPSRRPMAITQRLCAAFNGWPDRETLRPGQPRVHVPPRCGGRRRGGEMVSSRRRAAGTRRRSGRPRGYALPREGRSPELPSSACVDEPPPGWPARNARRPSSYATLSRNCCRTRASATHGGPRSRTVAASQTAVCGAGGPVGRSAAGTERIVAIASRPLEIAVRVGADETALEGGNRLEALGRGSGFFAAARRHEGLPARAKRQTRAAWNDRAVRGGSRQDRGARNRRLRGPGVSRCRPAPGSVSQAPSHRFPLSRSRVFHGGRGRIVRPGFQKRIAKLIPPSNSPLPLPRAAYLAAARSA